MTVNIESHLKIVALYSNSLADRGEVCSFAEIHSEIDGGTIIEWLKEKGADMSILLSPDMAQYKIAVIDVLQRVSNVLSGNESRKLALQRNGFCLLVALAIEAITLRGK